MNTGKVKKTQFKSLLYFPETKGKRVVTVHYFNLMATLSADESIMLNFLIKECTVYNTIKYSIRLMDKYKRYIEVIGVKSLRMNIHHLRKIFIQLVEKGLVLRFNTEHIINYNLTYMPQYSSQVGRWIRQYQSIQATENIEFMISGIEVINEQILKEIKK